MPEKEYKFQGFSPAAFTFLKGLKANNEKEWFAAHKNDFQEYLQSPLLNLADDLGEFMHSIDPELEIRPQKIVSRIYRDTRFAKDKSPYKTTMWITFKRPLEAWQDGPAYFLEIAPDSYRYGMGFYSAAPKTMAKFREQIDEKSPAFLVAISFYNKQKNFVVEGEEYKRILNDTLPAEMQIWYQRKSLYLVCNRNIDERLFSSKLNADLISGFSLLAPLYHYLWQVKLAVGGS